MPYSLCGEEPAKSSVISSPSMIAASRSSIRSPITVSSPSGSEATNFATPASSSARVMAASSAGLVVRTSPLGDDVVLLGAAVLVLSSELGVS